MNLGTAEGVKLGGEPAFLENVTKPPRFILGIFLPFTFQSGCFFKVYLCFSLNSHIDFILFSCWSTKQINSVLAYFINH